MKPTVLDPLRAAAALVLCASVAAQAAPGKRLEEEHKRTVSASGKKALVVKNSRGRTVIVGKADAPAVSVVAVKVVATRDGEQARRLMERLDFEITERGDEIVVETRDEPEGKREWSLWCLVGGGRRGAWIDLTLEVPHTFDVSAETASGEVRVSNLGGSAVATSASGEVSMRDVKGGATVRVTSGDADASDIGGDLRVSTVSGSVVVDGVKGTFELDGTSSDVHAYRVDGDAVIGLVSGDLVLEGCGGDVRFQTSSGDARIIEVRGGIEASSSSGDIEAMILPVDEKTFTFSSSSGDIDVYYVPVQEYGFQLDVATSSGSIEGDLPIKLDRVERRHLKGVVGSGGARVVIETASGDVSILERAESARKPVVGKP